MDEHAGCLCPPPLLGLALAFVEGLAKFLCLQRGHLGLLLVDLALVVELLALDVELPGLNLEQLALLLGEHLLVLCLLLERPDLLALLEERSDGEDGGNDREPREHSCGDGGYLRGHQERHGLSVGVVASLCRIGVVSLVRAAPGPPSVHPSPALSGADQVAGSRVLAKQSNPGEHGQEADAGDHCHCGNQRQRPNGRQDEADHGWLAVFDYPRG
jgi:hypothetical protein